jgi:hypothetical protein
MSLLIKPTLVPFSTCEQGKTQHEKPGACGLTDVVHSIEGIPGSPISLHYPTTVIKVSEKKQLSMALYPLIYGLFSDQDHTES